MSALAISIKPLNDHESAIARTVDRMTTEGSLYRTPIPKIAAALDFMMCRSDSEFLVNYSRWRMVNPVTMQAAEIRTVSSPASLLSTTP